VRQNLSRPTSSADGRFIYLTGQSGGLYRLSRDDGRVTALPNIPPLDEFPSFPSPSPDGHRLAFQFTYQQDQHIGLYDLDSLRVTDLGLLGESPRFSPDGSEIAFLTSHVQGWGLVIANSDGTGSRVVAVDMGEVLFPSWSPDGQWILLGSTVVNVASGLKLPLSYFSDGYNTYTTNAVWHP
jgi:dipeptidyl aminopeptidase/acylaminoacyl peptidase